MVYLDLINLEHIFMGIKSDDKGPDWHSNLPKAEGDIQFGTVLDTATYFKTILEGASRIFDQLENPQDQDICLEDNLRLLEQWDIKIGKDTLLQLIRALPQYEKIPDDQFLKIALKVEEINQRKANALKNQ